MKKVFSVFIYLFLVVFLSACSFEDFSFDFLTSPINTPETTTTENIITIESTSTTNTTSTSNTTTSESTSSTNTTSTSNTTTTTEVPSDVLYNYSDVHLDSAAYTLMPSTGNVKALVFQIGFTDALTGDYTTQQIDDAFFGQNTDTGWESLSSYYYKSSYGQLNITGTVLDIYQTNKSTTSITDDNDVREIFADALQYWDSSIDYNEYDSDNDGYIDAVYLIYTNDYNTNSGSQFWAYQSSSAARPLHDGVRGNMYVWASMNFLDYPNFYSGLNSSVFIHETGHMMGADDYYDYDDMNGTDWNVGQADMMSYNKGDHNAFTKMMYGWITPTIITSSQTIELDGFSTTGESIIVSSNWNGNNLSEYFIIDFYDNLGLDGTYSYSSDGGGFGVAGIRIYHVNATYTGDHIYEGIYPNIFDYDNSDTDYALLQLCERTFDSEDVQDGFAAKSNDLYIEGNTFNPLTLLSTNQILDTDIVNFNIYVNNVETNATITITFDN